MKPVTEERGFVIPAFNTNTVDYDFLAKKLAISIKKHNPGANIHIVTLENDIQDFGEFGPYANDVHAYYQTPYRQSIKLEADMLVASPIDHWWTMFEHRDVVISTGCRDFYDQPAESRFYRRVFDDNNLPDVYNAITYWRRSRLAHEFFMLVKNIFENWSKYRSLLKFCDEPASTDLVYAMAAKIIGPELVTMPFASYPKIVHMKRHIIPIGTNNWTKELVWETNPLRIQTVAQWGAFHYNIKDWRT